VTPETNPGPWPITARRGSDGALELGGVDLRHLAARYGTPLYVFDERTLRETARGFRKALAAHYPDSRVVYAGKAYLTAELVRIVAEEGLGLDVVSGGELFVALRGGMPPERISLHGNNKSRHELAEALTAGIGKIVIDNDHEISLLESLVKGRTDPVTVLIRINPGVEVHTHRKISTGIADSKFGFPIVDGQAEAAVARITDIPGLRLAGLHAHVGSQLFDSSSIRDGIDVMLDFAVSMRDRHGFRLEHLSPGGGFGIAYTDADRPLDRVTWARELATAIREGCERRQLPLPAVTIEPGRSIVGPAAVAVYETGAVKRLPGIRTYVSVDGGMADNIRPALYEATYVAAIANRDGGGEGEVVSIAGKYCESGDILIEGIELPTLEPGDLLAIPAAGAYTLSMSSNYNMALRPAVALVNDGQARLIRRRETYDDLIRCDTGWRHLTNEKLPR
jgi:diaminopimelate decarboxylase